MANFRDGLRRTMILEDGISGKYAYSMDPHDLGGETMHGIPIAVARAYGYQGPMKDIPGEIVRKIYQDKYWDLLHCSDLKSQEMANHIFDVGVNMGIGVAGKFAQTAFNNIRPLVG